jgi:hypothetical protein
MKKESSTIIAKMNMCLGILALITICMVVWSVGGMMVVIAEGRAQEETINLVTENANNLEQEYALLLQPLTLEFALANGYQDPGSVYFLEATDESVALLPPER